MKSIKDLCYIIEEELGKIADKGLNTSNLDIAYKLIDMYKDVKNTEYWDTKGEYYMQVLSEMRSGGYSESNGYDHEYSGRRDSMGRYSRDGGMGGNSYNNGNSYARGNSYNMGGHYSRSNGMDTYDGYMNEKQSYRSGGKSEDCKRRMLNALEEHLDKMTQELGDMSRDADCAEERQTINRYIDKIKKMM